MNRQFFSLAGATARRSDSATAARLSGTATSRLAATITVAAVLAATEQGFEATATGTAAVAAIRGATAARLDSATAAGFDGAATARLSGTTAGGFGVATTTVVVEQAESMSVSAAHDEQGSRAQHRDKGSFQHREGSFERKGRKSAHNCKTFLPTTSLAIVNLVSLSSLMRTVFLFSHVLEPRFFSACTDCSD